MSRYTTPFCSDEELLEELNKLGYDEIPPDVFNRMKDDLSDLIEKEQSNISKIVEKEHDLPDAEYDYNDTPSQSSKFFSASTSYDVMTEYHTKQESSKKSDSYVSRKVKKKSQKTNSRLLNNRDDDILERDSLKKAVDGIDIKSSLASFEYDNIYNDDILSELDDSQNIYGNINKVKSYENNVPRKSRADLNKNEDISYNSISKCFPTKENHFELNYSSNNDRVSVNSGTSVATFKSKVSKGSKLTNFRGKALDQVYNPSGTQSTSNDNSLKNVTDALKTCNLGENNYEPNESLMNDYKSSDMNLNISGSTGNEKKTIKRKVLRHRNGRSVITEELVEIPSIFDTSYPESENFNSSKSFSSDDLSYKSNNSTGSVAALSPESSLKSSPSTLSLSSRSTSLRISNTRKKKSDPVAMYSYYKRFWDNFKPPGENTHDRLRWAVRDKMLEYNI